jgi:hypothetical protein
MLMQSEPYAHNRIRRTKQAEDPVFGGQHGEFSVATLQPMGSEGFEAELVASIDPLALPVAPRPGRLRREPPPFGS